MSNAHLTAARKCNRFKGNARLLLLILADAASNGKPRKDGQANLPFGWTNKGVNQLKKDLNIPRRQTITDLFTELEHSEAIVRKQRLRQNAMTFVDIEWLKANSWTTPEAAGSEASGTESSGSVTGAGSDPQVHNGKRGICATESVASQMPRKTLRDTTESVARDLPAFDPSVDLPAPIGDMSRSRVRADDSRFAHAPQVWQEPEAKAAPKAKPERPVQKCRYCPNEAMPQDRMGRCMSCMKKMTDGWRERRPPPVSESVSDIQIADLLSAVKVCDTDGLD
jgi:hypothetical protein